MADCYARNAQRLDAEYDAGDSEFVLDSDNDDDFEGPTVSKLSRKGKSKVERKMDPKKKQKTPSAAINHYAVEGRDDEAVPTISISDSDSAEEEEEMPALATNLISRKSHGEDERMKIIDDLLMETKRIQEGLLSAASADISAADETQEDDSECQISESTREMDLDLNPKSRNLTTAEPVQENRGPKCIVCVKARDADRVRKFKISMNDTMNKVFEAFCKTESVSAVRCHAGLLALILVCAAGTDISEVHI
eukprot:317572-Hanusia_phi.AAC.1